MSGNIHDLFIVAVAAAVTIAIRFAPFVVFRNHTPSAVLYLGEVLPYAIMGMLVVYCLKGVHPFSWPFGLPELIAVAVVAVLHLKWRQMLVSIAGGTIVYMLLVQLVFKV